LTNAWPAELRGEIEAWNLPEAQVALPTEAVRDGLQRGRITFTWATLRSWITPPPPSADSVHDSATVELPLPILTPLFLASQKQPAKPLKKSSVDEIPDLFFDDRKGEIPKTNGEHDEAPVQARSTTAPPKTTPVAASPAPSLATPKAAPQPQPVPAPQPAQNTGVMRIPLKDLTAMWPEELRAEIAGWDLSPLMVALPAEAINGALKQGKVIFPWKTLCSWITPAPPSAISSHDKTALELPLPVIMPIFLAGRKQPAKTRPQALDDDIPDPFAEFMGTPPAAQKNGTPVPEPARTEKVPGTTSFARKNKAAPSNTEAKLQPKIEPPAALPKRSSTPAEILASAIKLEGVAGALVALSDGFKVASKLPPDMDGDALAAFLPHIFSKVNQSTRELRMGDLNNLNFTVDNIPWKIFRVNQIFFAALGHAGQSMPTAELVALAHQLTFKN
jgi:predicted regulator of Ras-like GTPase activity (Roadblock/LC7/MglB family)